MIKRFVYIIAAIVVFFLLMIQTIVSNASTYYECTDRNGNTLLTDQPKIPSMKCKPIMQAEEKSQTVIQKEKGVIQEEKKFNERKWSAEVKKRESEYLNRKYLEKRKEIQDRYLKDDLNSGQFCNTDRYGRPAPACEAVNQARSQAIQKQRDIELKKADEEYRQAFDEINRQP